jgi:DNA-binding NarL/FixJ family response regulator
VDEVRTYAQSATPCDLAILDIGSTDGSGIELLTELRSDGWPRIVVLAVSSNPHIQQSAFTAGAQAYLLKPALPVAVTDRARHDFHINLTVAPILALATQMPILGNQCHVSAREAEVLQLVADGQSNKEIAKALNLSPATVKSHLARIFRRLGAGDRAQLVAMVMRAGIIH